MATESVIPGDLPPLIRYRWVRLFVAIMSAGTAIVIAALTNTISKGLIAFVMGSSDMRPIIIPTFAVSIVLGGIALALVLLL